jgi:hypothetical protein
MLLTSKMLLIDAVPKITAVAVVVGRTMSIAGACDWGPKSTGAI